MAQLDALAFEGATKRSKPNLKVCLLLFFLNPYNPHSENVNGQRADDRSVH